MGRGKLYILFFISKSPDGLSILVGGPCLFDPLPIGQYSSSLFTDRCEEIVMNPIILLFLGYFFLFHCLLPSTVETKVCHYSQVNALLLYGSFYYTNTYRCSWNYPQMRGYYRQKVGVRPPVSFYPFSGDPGFEKKSASPFNCKDGFANSSLAK